MPKPRTPVSRSPVPRPPVPRTPIRSVRAPIAEDALLRRYIKRGKDVVCIGALESPGEDPSALYAGHLVHKAGSVTIVDLKSERLWMLASRRAGNLERIGKPSPKLEGITERMKGKLGWGGRGDPYAYWENVKALVKAGAPVRVPSVKLGNAHSLPLRENSADVIVDRGSLAWMIGSLPAEYTDQVVSSYMRVLKPGGKAIFILHDPDVPPGPRSTDRPAIDYEIRAAHRELPAALSGFKVERFAIRTQYDFKKILEKVKWEVMPEESQHLYKELVTKPGIARYAYDYALVVTKEKAQDGNRLEK